MRKFTIALASAAILGFAVPALALDKAPGQERIQLAQADVKIKVKEGDRRGEYRRSERRKVVIRHDSGRHLGFAHSRHEGYGRHVTVIKKKPGKTVIKKFEG